MHSTSKQGGRPAIGRSGGRLTARSPVGFVPSMGVKKPVRRPSRDIERTGSKKPSRLASAVFREVRLLLKGVSKIVCAVMGSALPPDLSSLEPAGGHLDSRRHGFCLRMPRTLLSFCSSSKYNRLDLARSLSASHASLGFRSLQRIQHRGATYPGLNPARLRCVFRVSTLLTL
jgi:hypothetical protein